MTGVSGKVREKERSWRKTMGDVGELKIENDMEIAIEDGGMAMIAGSRTLQGIHTKTSPRSYLFLLRLHLHHKIVAHCLYQQFAFRMLHRPRLDRMRGPLRQILSFLLLLLRGHVQ
jgi:hypothetical protein